MATPTVCGMPRPIAVNFYCCGAPAPCKLQITGRRGGSRQRDGPRQTARLSVKPCLAHCAGHPMTAVASWRFHRRRQSMRSHDLPAALRFKLHLDTAGHDQFGSMNSRPGRRCVRFDRRQWSCKQHGQRRPAGPSRGTPGRPGAPPERAQSSLLAGAPQSTPPSMIMCCPVMKLPAGEARKTAAPAISSGSPIRFSGVSRVRFL